MLETTYRMKQAMYYGKPHLSRFVDPAVSIVQGDVCPICTSVLLEKDTKLWCTNHECGWGLYGDKTEADLP